MRWKYKEKKNTRMTLKNTPNLSKWLGQKRPNFAEEPCFYRLQSAIVFEDLTAKILLCKLVYELDICGQLGRFACRPGLRQGLKSQPVIARARVGPKLISLLFQFTHAGDRNHARGRKTSRGKRTQEKSCKGTRGMRWAAGG